MVNGITSSRRHTTSAWSPSSLSAVSAVSGPPPARISPPGATVGGVCARKSSGTDHFTLAVVGVQRPQRLVAAVDVDGLAVGGQHRTCQHTVGDGVAGPLPGQQRRLAGVVAQRRSTWRPVRRAARRRITIVWVAAEKAGAAAIGHFGRAVRAVGQAARESVGSMSATRSIGLPTTIAAVRVEHQHLPEMGHHQQLTVAEKPWGQRHSDDLLAPADPLGGRIRQDQPGLADVEVVEPVEQRAGESAALAPAGCTSAGARCCRSPTPSASSRPPSARWPPGSCPSRARPRRPRSPLTERLQASFRLVGAGGGGVAAVGRVAVLGGPALRRCGVDPGVGVAAAVAASAVAPAITVVDASAANRRSTSVVPSSLRIVIGQPRG